MQDAKRRKKISNTSTGNPIGAPPKSEADKMKPHTFNMNDPMWERIEAEAKARNVKASDFGRQVFDWFFTVLDTKRADVETNKLFDTSQ